MHNADIFHLRHWRASILLAFAIILNCRTATADGEAREKLPLTAKVSNGNITLSWPVTPGKWQLWEKEPADGGTWKPVSEAQCQTNDTTVSATLPLPQQTALYLVSRLPPLRPPSIKNLPPVPPAPTNRPPNFRPRQP